jgi:biotin synthase
LARTAKVRKYFFFGKKKQKTSIRWARGCENAPAPIQKSFLLLFSKKEGLSLLSYTHTHSPFPSRLARFITISSHSGNSEKSMSLTLEKPPTTRTRIAALLVLPLPELIFQAQTVHRKHFSPTEVQISTLLSIKTGGCPEDCGYCPQSSSFEAGVPASKLMDIEPVLEAARRARDAGAQRFCMGAAWRSPKDHDLDRVAAMVTGVKALGMETCVTLGMLRPDQADRLKSAGLDYYNHNLDTSPEFYGKIITSRIYQDRLDTIAAVREAGINVCCGGIIGMGEDLDDRAGLLATLADLDPYPESVPINALVAVKGTALGETAPLDPIDFVRTIAAARIAMPKSYVRLSAGRESLSDEAQALCFLAGANSIFYGDTLLTTSNPAVARDNALFEKLGMTRQS